MNLYRIASRVAEVDPYDDPEWMEIVDDVWETLKSTGIKTDPELQDTLNVIMEHITEEHLWDKWDFSFGVENNYEFKNDPQYLIDGVKKEGAKSMRAPYAVWLELGDNTGDFAVFSGNSRDDVIKVLTDTANITPFTLEGMMRAKGFRAPWDESESDEPKKPIN